MNVYKTLRRRPGRLLKVLCTFSLRPVFTGYKHVILLGDFDVETKGPCMQSFFGLRNLISEPTCYKNPESTSSIVLILTNSSLSFQNSCVIKTGLPDFHKMTNTVMKTTTFHKLKPKLIYYQDYSMFSSHKFRKELLSKLSMEIISNTSNGLKNFLESCIGVLDKLASQKKKYNRGMTMII